MRRVSYSTSWHVAVSAKGQVFDILICIKRSPSRVIRCRGEKGTGWFFEMVADSNQPPAVSGQEKGAG